jgi:hypothetical protein
MAWPRRHTTLPALPSLDETAGKRILVWWEQGFGDTIHFSRYVPMLAKHAKEVVFEVQPSLAALMRTLARTVIVATDGASPARCDAQVPLLSLPRLFGTRIESIPANVPYLGTDDAKVREWRDRLVPGRRAFGVTCAGHAQQKDNKARSMALRDLAPLLDIGDLYVVQVEVSEVDREFAREHVGRIHLLDDAIHDFTDTAAILESVDAVVTVDSAVAHLAGALARPTWIMLPWTPTWRWMVDRHDSPWYPTARLVRQSERGRWDDVVARAARELAG